MRLTLDEEPTFEEIESAALTMFGTDYWDNFFGFPEDKERVDMEHAAEQKLIAERIRAKQINSV